MWCEFATTGLQTLHGSILSLQASTVIVQSPPRLHFEPLKLLNSDIIADADPALTLMRIRALLPKKYGSMRIQIRNPGLKKDPDSQPWFK